MGDPAVVNAYRCDNCEFEYNSSDYSRVDFDAQPADFECPRCQAGKDHFHLVVPSGTDVAPDPGTQTEETALPDPTGVRVMFTKKSDPQLDSLHKQYKKQKIDTQPDFQRYEVWSVQKKSALIESILLDLPVPQVYFAEESDGTSVVIDGQQRLMAIFRFLDNEFALKGVNSKIEGKTYAELGPKLQDKIDTYELHVVKILPESDPEVRFTLFQRLNEGSVSLNDQELRNCVFRGPYNDFLKNLANDPVWAKALNLTKPHPRMIDVELVLRYMAFRDQSYMKHPDKKTGRFLDKQMSIGSAASVKDLELARKEFKQAVEVANTVFGAHAFRRFVSGDEKFMEGGWDNRTNRALMDVQLWGFTRYEKGLFVKNSDAVREASIELMATPEFSDLITHTISEFKRIERRFDLWKEMLDSVLASENMGPRLFSRSAKEASFKLDSTCQVCHQNIQEIDDAHMDHVEPFSKGGKTVPSNAALTHRFCNLSKSNK